MSTGPGHAQGGTPAAPATPPTPAAPVTPPDAATQIAHSLADLADTLKGWRDRFDAVIAKDEQDAADRAERDRRREPAEWQAALDTLRTWLNGRANSVPMSEDDRQKADDLLNGIVPALDDDLRRGGYTSLRYALECLSGPNPPEASLADIAAQKAHSLPSPEERDLYARGWLDGATREETG